MIIKLFKRGYWILFKRFFIRAKYPGFKAGPRTFLYKNCKFSEYNSLSGDAILLNTSLGRFSYIAGGQVFNTTIGAFSSIGPDVKIGGFGKHPTNWLSTHPAFYSKSPPTKMTFSESNHFNEFLPVTIGNDVWIGARVLILDGVHIGDGAIVAAGSIVTKDIQPYHVVGGVPAKTIRKRFDDKEIKLLLNNPWWNKDLEFYKKNQKIFRGENIHDLVKLLL